MSEVEGEIEFDDINLGPMLLKQWGGEPWLFTKHPDGQWVSHKKVTEDDLSILKKAGIVSPL